MAGCGWDSQLVKHAQGLVTRTQNFQICLSQFDSPAARQMHVRINRSYDYAFRYDGIVVRDILKECGVLTSSLAAAAPFNVRVREAFT